MIGDQELALGAGYVNLGVAIAYESHDTIASRLWSENA